MWREATRPRLRIFASLVPRPFLMDRVYMFKGFGLGMLGFWGQGWESFRGLSFEFGVVCGCVNLGKGLDWFPLGFRWLGSGMLDNPLHAPKPPTPAKTSEIHKCGFPQIRGPQYGTRNIRILLIRTPK